LAVALAGCKDQHPVVLAADDIVCLEDHEFLGAIGIYYADLDKFRTRK
jgi:hypothetical protein